MPPKRKHSGGKTLHREALSKTLTVAELNSIKNNTILNKLEVAIGNQDRESTYTDTLTLALRSDPAYANIDFLLDRSLA